MPDQITVKQDQQEKSFAPAPAGSQPAVAVDTIDLGWTADQYEDQPIRVIHKVALVFQTDEENPDTGKRYEPSIEFTVGQEFEDGNQVTTFGERSKLRKFLTDWRGKPYTKEEALAGAPLHKLVGVNAILNIQHKTSKKDRVYAVIAGVTPPIKGMAKLVPHGYERAEFWDAKKLEYANKLAAYRATVATTGFDEMPASLQVEDDDLPF